MTGADSSRGSMHSDPRMIVVFAGGPAIGLAIAYGVSEIVGSVLTGFIFSLIIGMVIAILSLGLVEQIIKRVPT